MKNHVVSNNQEQLIKNQKQNDLDEDITRILEILGFKIIITGNSDNIDELERLYTNDAGEVQEPRRRGPPGSAGRVAGVRSHEPLELRVRIGTGVREQNAYQRGCQRGGSPGTYAYDPPLGPDAPVRPRLTALYDLERRRRRGLVAGPVQHGAEKGDPSRLLRLHPELLEPRSQLAVVS